jgi:hypothetical protein
LFKHTETVAGFTLISLGNSALDISCSAGTMRILFFMRLFQQYSTKTAKDLATPSAGSLTGTSFLVGFSAVRFPWRVTLPQNPVFLRLFLIGGFQTFISSPEFYCPYNTWYPRPGL